MTTKPEISRVSPDATAASVLEVLSRDGCVVIERLAPDETVKNIQAELAPYLDRVPNSEGPFQGYKTKRLGALPAKAPSSVSLITHPLVKAALDSVLLPSCSRYQVNLGQVVHIEPGQGQQMVHRDDFLFPFPKNGLQVMINAQWAISDFTEENGGTVIAPGHFDPDVTSAPDPSAFVSTAMPAGSLLLYLGSMWHGGGANTSDKPRTGLVYSYNLGWLRQAENHYLALPTDLVRDLPTDVRELLGYKIHEPNLGWVEGQDPSIALEEPSDVVRHSIDYFPEHLIDYVRSKSA